MSHKESGWHNEVTRLYAYDFNPVVELSGWDLLLRELELTDEDVIVLLSSPLRSTKSEQLRLYARTQRLGHYVPEDVLDLLGLKAGADSYQGPLEMSVQR